MTSRLSGTGIETPLLNGTDPGEGRSIAWANLNGTGVIAVRDSLNISGATDNGTGDYTFIFSSAMVNSTYCAVPSAVDVGTGRGTLSKDTYIASPNSFRATFGVTNGVDVLANDCEFVLPTIIGTLA